MKVLALILLSSLLLLTNICVAENLFIRSSGLFIKGKLFSKLYKEANDNSPDHGIDGNEDRLASIARNAPLLGTQAILSAFVCSNCIAQLFNVIPQAFTVRIRQQCLLVVIAVKLMDLYRELDIAPFKQRDNLYNDELVQRAVTEVRALAGGAIGRTLSYYCLCLVTVGQAQGCLAPFVISELPNLLRFGVIAAVAASPAQGTASAGTFSTLLFPDAGSATDKESQDINSMETLLDRICSGISESLEVYLVARTLLRLLDFRSGGGVRGTQDMLVLAVQLLLIQHHLTLRARDLLRDHATSVLSMQGLLSMPGAEQLSAYVQLLQARVRSVAATIQRLISTDTRSEAWRALQSALGLGVRPKSYKKASRKGKSRRRDTAGGKLRVGKATTTPSESESASEEASGDRSQKTSAATEGSIHRDGGN